MWREEGEGLQEDFNVEGRGFNGNSRKEGKAREEMVDLLLVHWEFVFADNV